MNLKISDSSSSTYDGTFYVAESVLGDSDAYTFFRSLQPNLQLENVAEAGDTTINDENYKGFSFSGRTSEISSYIEIKNHLKTTELVLHLGDLFKNVETFEILSSSDEELNLKDYGLEVLINIEMPGTIIETNVGEHYGTKMQLDLLEVKVEDVVIVSQASTKQILTSFVFFSICALILCLLIWFARKRLYRRFRIETTRKTRTKRKTK